METTLLRFVAALLFHSLGGQLLSTNMDSKSFLAYYGGDVINQGDTIVLSSSGGTGFEPMKFIVSAWLKLFTNPGGNRFQNL